jgi:hypothetical protein
VSFTELLQQIGFCVWLERKIIGSIEGKARRDMEGVLLLFCSLVLPELIYLLTHTHTHTRTHTHTHSHTLAVIEHDAANKSSLQSLLHSPAALSLVQDMSCVDPDDYFSSIPYEKGSQLLLWLERAIVKDGMCVIAIVIVVLLFTITNNEQNHHLRSAFKDGSS